MTDWGPRGITFYGFAWFLAMVAGTLFFYNFTRREDYPERVFFTAFLTGYFFPVLGARLGHCFFYEFEYYSANPGMIFSLSDGGMASHGAAIGLLAGFGLFAWFNRMPYVWALDRLMVPVTLGGAFVRIGNLMNSEIYGTATDLPWGFIFVRAGETMPKHPTQIYEAVCYLLVFVLLVWMYYRKDSGRRLPGLMLGVGLTGIFLSRFLIEFLKNDQVGFEHDMMFNMGQWLSFPFILAGMVLMFFSLRKAGKTTGGTKPVE